MEKKGHPKDLLDMLIKHFHPYDHPGDVRASHLKWDVGPSELFTEWFRELIHNCRRTSGCDLKERCIYFEDRKESAENWRICKATFGELETGRLEVRSADSPEAGKEASGEESDS